jgi:Skp family chaperone for outer membrane proteins
MNLMKCASILTAAVLLACASAVSAAPANNTNSIAVVDVQKIFNESKPGKAAAAHMQEVQKILQKGMDDVVALNKGKESTPEAQRSIAEAQQLLNRQLDVERQAANAVVENELRAAVSVWLSKNKRFTMVVSKQLLLGNADSIDFTSSIMKEMNRRNPKFPDLPKVTINPPQNKQKTSASK